MKKKNIFLLIVSLCMLLSLNSCFLSNLTSIFNNENVKNTIELLNNAFNAKVDINGNPLFQDFSTIEYNNDFDKAERFTVQENISRFLSNKYDTPSSGNVNSLVIPVEFKDYKAKDLKVKDLLPDYQSVASYLYNSSYGKLNITFDVLDWQMMSKNSTYYDTLDENLYESNNGPNAIKDEALSKIESKVDLSKYDNNSDGIIDSLIIIYSAPIQYQRGDLYWAYKTEHEQLKEYDGLRAQSYAFMGYSFLLSNNKSCDTRTFIHETSHLLGLEDYYDYSSKVGYSKGGLGGADMMDLNRSDHNPFSKMYLGWVDNPILVNLEKGEETIITIDSFSTNGDCIILANDFYKRDGMFQDYFIVYLYDADNPLNKKQTVFTEDGVRVLRIHGQANSFYCVNDNSYTDYNVIDNINNNKEGFIYTKYEYALNCAKKSDLFYENEGASNMTYYDDESEKLDYGFKVLKIEDNKATIKIFKE